MTNKAFNIEEIDALLSKYFSGEATPEEAMIIDDWRAGNDQNAEQFNALWLASPLKPYQIPDVPTAWRQMHPLPRRQSVKKIMIFRWVAAAALILCISVAAALLFQQHEHITYKTISANKTEKILLPDSSVAIIRSGSNLTYPTSFNGKQRDVVLKGEAYFDIMPATDQPFVVTVGPAKIKVLGTSFNVADTQTVISVHVHSGKVMIYTDKDSIIISSAQKVSWLRNSESFSLPVFYFNFENEDLKTVATYLSEAYHKKIYIKDTDIASLRISSTFENKPLDYILQVIATTLNITFTYSNQDEIYFEKS
jgi:ferric-dicitrate binding protein FerR (iron transport regulator)